MMAQIMIPKVLLGTAASTDGSRDWGMYEVHSDSLISAIFIIEEAS